MNLYTILPINPLEYKTEILRLWERNHPDLAPILPKRFTWIYENNPYGTPKCWLLKHNKTNKFIGAASLIPRRMYVNGKPMMAGIAADMMIEKKHRTLGPALMLERAVIDCCKKGEFDFIYGFSPPAAYTAQIKAGFKFIGNAIRMVRPLKTASIIEKQKGKTVATLFSPLLDTTLQIIDNFTFITKSFLKPNFSCCILDHFDERFDNLWHKAPKNGLIIGERTASYLNWRYMKSPYHKHKTFILQDKKEKILGYIIYSLIDDKALIYDIYAENQYSILLLNFIKLMRKTGICSISFTLIENNPLVKHLKSSFFLKREEPLKIIIFNSNITQSFSNWYLVAGDKDTE